MVALLCLTLFKPAAWLDFKKHRDLWWLLLAAGLANVGFNWAVTVGDVVRAVLLFYLMPAWVVLLAWPLLGEKPSAGSLIMLSEVVFASVSAVWLGAGELSTSTLVGGGLILLASLLSVLTFGRR